LVPDVNVQLPVQPPNVAGEVIVGVKVYVAPDRLELQDCAVALTMLHEAPAGLLLIDAVAAAAEVMFNATVDKGVVPQPAGGGEVPSVH
jgi:hypothetical protein